MRRSTFSASEAGHETKAWSHSGKRRLARSRPPRRVPRDSPGAGILARRKARRLNNLRFQALCWRAGAMACDATNMFSWEEISSFGSLRERDRFLTWMRDQIADGLAEEVHAPTGTPSGAADLWFRHVPTGTLWRLVSAENPYGPGFWAVRDQAA